MNVVSPAMISALNVDPLAVIPKNLSNGLSFFAGGVAVSVTGYGFRFRKLFFVFFFHSESPLIFLIKKL